MSRHTGLAKNWTLFALKATLGSAMFLSGASALAALLPASSGVQPGPIQQLATGLNPVLATQVQTPTNSPLITFPTFDTSGVTWNGYGDLPNAFRRPWVFPETNFDPSFRTSYWNEVDGFMNVDSAPWNRGMAALYGPQIYTSGLKRVGEYDMRGLIPQFNSSSAAVAL